MPEESATKLLYAYAYNEQNDVFTVRGVEEWEIGYIPRPIKSVPQGLLKQMAIEFVGHSGLKPEELTPTLSCADDASAIIVDFHDRIFSTDQVKTIMNNGFVSKPKKIRKPFVNRIIPLFNSRKSYLANKK